MLLASLFYAGVNGNYSVLLSELFDTQVRFSGVAICYNFAFAVCGGVVPLLYAHFTTPLGVLVLPTILFTVVTI